MADEVTRSPVTTDEVTWDKVRGSGDTGGDVRDTGKGHGASGAMGRWHKEGVTRGDTRRR